MERQLKVFGTVAAIMTVILTVITFIIAILTPPLSGPWCEASCYTYPYSDILGRFPRDYYWMYPAMVLNLFVIALFVFIHFLAPANKKIFTALSLIGVVTGAIVLNIDYFLQVSVVQPSLLAGETDGLALITQFNAHGIFIVLEEFRFSSMILGFLCAAPAFAGPTIAEKAVHRIFIAGFVMMLLSFVAISAFYGLQREYRYEIAVISITWLMLIPTGLLLSRIFQKHWSIPQNN